MARAEESTIAAIATPPGPGRRGVIRVSGPLAASLVRAVLREPRSPPMNADGAPAPDATSLPPARRGLVLARFHDGRGEQPAMLLWMPAPASYTREDVAEFHLPGSPPLLAAALERLLALGAVAAAPGEFTRRAFESGRIDLTRAEGVLALVRAEGLAEQRSAMALLSGGLERRVESLRSRLDELRALCEAALDFSEHETGAVEAREIAAGLAGAREELARTLALESAREPGGGEPRVVLCGAPGAGKSSLFNALAGGRALVGRHPGTTRDWLEAPWSAGGASLRLFDTPGLDPGAGGADARAQELARAVRESADLALWVVDAGSVRAPRSPGPRASLPAGVPALLAWNKVDLPGAPPEPPGEFLDEPSDAPDASGGPGSRTPWVAISARERRGLEDLERAVAGLLGARAVLPDGAGEGGPDPGPGPAGGLGRELFLRHRSGLEAAALELERAGRLLAESGPLDLVAECLRGASAGLDRITGRGHPEELLDRIFARFCLGK